MHVAIIGGGPAGLFAAETIARSGVAVTVFDAKRSVGRKLLVAGRGGLNLTHDEPSATFATRYSGPEQPPRFWPQALARFDAGALRLWADQLGAETFAASTGRVYPRGLKAAPLLRSWLGRLRELGVQFATSHRWTGRRSGQPLTLIFSTQQGPREFSADAVIFALGGGSWPETGSDGSWVETFAQLGIATDPLESANCGWEVTWSGKFLAQAEGLPLKNIVAKVHDESGALSVAGELLITSYGLEGGLIYQLGPALRRQKMPTLFLDLKPANSAESLCAKISTRTKDLLASACASWRLSATAAALLESADSHFTDARALANLAKNFPLTLVRPRPLAEAISSAGGVRWSELDSTLMLHRWPGAFAAGEMISWVAPTGGYLLQGCFSSGALAAHSALAWLSRST